MQKLRLFFILMFLFESLQGIAMAEKKAVKKVAKQMPTEIQLLNWEKVKVNKTSDLEKKKGYFCWPSVKKISVCLRPSDEPVSVARERHSTVWFSIEKGTVTDAKRTAEHWIKTILQDKWVPTDIHDQLIALDSDIDGYDSIRVRYETNGYYIQIVQTNPMIVIIIKNVSQEKKSVLETIDLFFNKSKKIEQTSISQVKFLENGLRGEANESELPEASNQWWGRIHWFSDGEAIVFCIPKYYGGAGIPYGLPKDWF